jgi:signal peptidase
MIGRHPAAQVGGKAADTSGAGQKDWLISLKREGGVTAVSGLTRIAARLARPAGYLLSGALTAAMLAAAVVVLWLHVGLQTVLTGSMRPHLNPGDVAVSRLEPVRDLHSGQVIVFVPPGQGAPYAHRVTSVTGPPGAPVITTKGDANPVPDPWHARIDAAQVRVVFGRVPLLGRALLWVHGPQGRAAAVGVIGLLVTGVGCGALWRTGKRGVSRPHRHRASLNRMT